MRTVPLTRSAQFSVAAPAVFPRGGSPIPIWVHLRTRDRQALETITSAGHLQVSLDRVLSWATTTTNASARSESADEPRTVAPARLWPVSGGPTEPATDMHFQGEVMPPGNLTPSFMAPSFQLGVCPSVGRCTVDPDMIRSISYHSPCRSRAYTSMEPSAAILH